MNRTYSNSRRQTYEPSGRELRIYWDERPETHDDGMGDAINGWSYAEAVLPISATAQEIVAVIAGIDPDANARQLAEGWLLHPDYHQPDAGHSGGGNLGENGRTLIVPAADAPLARTIAAAFGPGGEGMWQTGLSADGEAPASHYVSSGFIPPEFAHMVPCQYWTQDEDGNWTQTGEDPGQPEAVYEAMVAAGVEVTLDQIQWLFLKADVTAQDPYVAFGRLGLEQVRSEDEL